MPQFKKFMGFEYGRATDGGFLVGRVPKSQRGPGAGERIKNLFSRDNVANKYATIDDLNKGSGKGLKGLFKKKSSPAESITSLDKGSSMLQSDATALQSDAMSGQIYGGTADQRSEAASLASGGPAESKGGKGGGGGASMLGPGLAIGSAALDALDNDPGYGGMDVGKETLKYASMGAAAGPIGAGVGAVVGAGIGLFKKKKFEKEEKKQKAIEASKRKSSEALSAINAEAQSFYENQGAASSDVYGTKDVDMFINKYAQ